MRRSAGIVLSLTGIITFACGDDGIDIEEGPDPEPDVGYPLPTQTEDSFLSCSCMDCAAAPPGALGVVTGCTVEGCDADPATLEAACEQICTSFGFIDCTETAPYMALDGTAPDCAERQCVFCGEAACPAGACYPEGQFCTYDCNDDDAICQECLDCRVGQDGNKACYPPTPLDGCEVSGFAPSEPDMEARFAHRLHGLYTAVLTDGSSFELDADGLEGPAIEIPHGEIRFVAHECPGSECRLQLTDLRFRADDLVLDLDDPAGTRTISDLDVFLRRRAPVDVANGVLVAGTAEFALRYLAEGVHQDSTMQNLADMAFAVDFGTGALSLDGSMSLGPGHVTMHLQADFVNRPPLADAGADQVVECTTPAAATAVLDGSGSDDIGPGPALDSLEWFEPFDNVAETGTLVATGDTPMLELSLGLHALTLRAADSAGAYDLDEVFVEIVDTTPPTIIAPPESVEVCLPMEAEVEIPQVVVADECSTPEQIALSVVVSSVKGHPVGALDFPIVDGKVTLPIGEHELTWTAVDAQGLVTVVVQEFTVAQVVGPSCCEDDQTLVEGTDAAENLAFLDGAGYCIFGYGADDTLETRDDDDFLAGGADDDTLNSGADNDVCLGEDGSDVLNTRGDPNGMMAFGGPGDDIVIGSDEGELLYGNAGDDTINAHAGNDRIVPGPGIDTVRAQQGDDTVVIYHACEVGPGEHLDGGAGSNDTLVTPLSLAQLGALGVFVSHFEVIVIDTDNGLLAECS